MPGFDRWNSCSSTVNAENYSFTAPTAEVEVQHDLARPNGDGYGSATHAFATLPQTGRRLQVMVAGICVACAMVAMVFWTSRPQEVAVLRARPRLWEQQLALMAQKVQSGPKHAGNDGQVTNPFEVAYDHPVDDTPKKTNAELDKWEQRFHNVFSFSRNLGELGDMTGYNDMEKLPKEGIVQGANLPQRNFIRLRNHEQIPDQSKMIGFQDKLVPAQEYVGSPHNTGWDAQTYEGAEEYLAHLHGNLDFKTVWDTTDILNAAMRDKLVKQDIYEKEDGEGNQGRQWGGVVVDWRTLYHQVKPEETGEDTKIGGPHFAHRADGSIKLELPKGGFLPYRAAVQTTVFRPCKKHPVEGCPFEPPMALPPPAPAAMPVKTKEGVDEFLANSENKDKPKLFVDQEDQRFNKKLFDLAAKFEVESAAPISAAHVETLVREAKQTAGPEWIEKEMNTNVFKYMLENYELDAAAKAKIQQILVRARSSTTGKSSTGKKPGGARKARGAAKREGEEEEGGDNDGAPEENEASQPETVSDGAAQEESQGNGDAEAESQSNGTPEVESQGNDAAAEEDQGNGGNA